MKAKKVLLVLTMLFTFPLLSGCWDRLEIEDRGAILGLAIDPLEGKADAITGPAANSNIVGYNLTAQIAIPGRIPLGPGEGTAGGGKEKPVWIIHTQGKTIDDAMSLLQQELADKVFLGQLRVIIVNQKIAQSNGMSDIQDFLRRNAEIRRLAWLLVSTGPALEAMEAAPKLERVPTLYLIGTMDHAVQLGKLPNVFLGNYWTTLSSSGRDAVLPLISVFHGDRIATEGLAVFRGYQMVGMLNPLEVAAYMELTGEKRAGYGVALPIPGDPKHSVIFKGFDRRERIKVHMEHGRPVFDMYSRIEANIEEKTGLVPLDTVHKQLEREAEQALLDGQYKVIDKLKGLHADVVGFGEYVRGQFPVYWKTNIQTKSKWEAEFPNIQVRAHVKIYFRRGGMTMH